MLKIVCGLLICLYPTSLAAQQLAFELLDWRGELISVQPQRSTLTAVCFLGTECPMAKAYVSRLNEIHHAYAAQGVQVIGVMSNRQDSLQDVMRYAESLDLQFKLVLDSHNQVADRYGATRTPEVFLLDQELKLRYRGRINDQYAPGVARSASTREDLQIALDELLAGKPVSVKETPALGCIIGKEKESSPATHSEQQVTFVDQILPVLERNCIECHRRGEIGPFAMQDFDEVVGWADTMLETIENGRMPPWHADPAHGSFSNARHMSGSDQQLFRDWIAGGLQKGQSSSPPRTAQFVDGWQMQRSPDAIFEMRNRPFSVPKDGTVEYQYFVVDPEFTEDKWVSAAQVLPGSRDVVHHAIVFVRPPDGAQFQGVGWLTAYVPGQRVMPLSAGRARKIPAGSKLVFQMHYTPNGTEREDITRLGLLFANEADVTHTVLTLMAIDQEFEIPPQVSNHATSASLPWLPAQGELLSATPHMHVRGKSFTIVGEQAELGQATTEQILLSVPSYDFNWQHTYIFSKPLPLQELKGLRFMATFDNSTDNPFNPDPNEWVTWGDQTWEEMAVAFVDVSVPRDVSGERHRSRSNGDKRVQGEKPKASQKDSQIESYVARVLQKMDSNDDGVIRKSEAPIVVREYNFSRWDRDGDDVVTQDEIRQVAKRLYQ